MTDIFSNSYKCRCWGQLNKGFLNVNTRYIPRSFQLGVKTKMSNKSSRYKFGEDHMS